MVPSIFQAAPSRLAVASMPEASHLPFASANASVAIVSPDAMPGRSARCAASSPASSKALTASTTVEKYGRAQQRPAHLLEHDAELDVAEPLPSERLGDDEALEAQLLGHRGPHRGIEAAPRLHLLANGRLGGVGLDEAPDHPAELFLLLGEGEGRAHRRSGRSARGSLGSPSVRSATMLRWISSVPP